jgi:hypothetical protein
MPSHFYIVSHQVLNHTNDGWNHGETMIEAETSALARRAALNVLKHDNPGRSCVVRSVKEVSYRDAQKLRARPPLAQLGDSGSSS